MSEEPQQQQEEPAKLDMGVAFGTLTPDNRTMLERKGWAKDGKPVDTFNLNVLADNYRTLETKVGVKTLAPPDLSTPEAFDKWEGHSLLGVPGKPEEYKFERPALPEGLKWSEAEGDGGVVWDAKAETTLRTALAKGKVGQAQAARIFTEMAQGRIGEIAAARASRTNETAVIKASLEKDFGAGLAGARESGKQAIAFIAEKAKLDPAKAIDGLGEAMGNEAAVRFSIQLGKMLGEDQLKEGKINGFATGPEAAKAELATMEADPETRKALFDKKHAGHKTASEKRNRLYALAYPDG